MLNFCYITHVVAQFFVWELDETTDRNCCKVTVGRELYSWKVRRND